MREIEIKYRLPDPGRLRSQLRALGARRLGRFLELNRMLDFADGRLRAAGTGLRLRTTWRLGAQRGERASPVALSTARHILTFKGPVESPGPVRARAELETRIADADTFLQILAAIGVSERLRFEKRRECWRVPTAEIAIDRLPKLGWFCEIEAASEAEIRAISDQLALSAHAAESQTYPALVSAIASPASDGVLSLRFD